ncbi:MAG: hypothetical protein ABSD77_01990 [Verrucomicrobiota bacterium]
MEANVKNSTSSTSALASPAKTCVRHEWKWMVAVLFIFAVFNIVSAPYSPTPWLDEVAYTDPGASLALEGTFTSTLWAERGTPLWTGNVPLHQLALAGFFKVFGFSCRVARSANVVYYTLAILLICQMIRNYNILQTARARWLFFWILLAGTGLTALYRNGRYDTIGCLLYVGWVFCSLQSQRRPLMLLGVGLAASLMPAAGLVLGPLLLVSGIAAFFLWRWKAFRVLMITGIGAISGILIMQFFYQRLGVPCIFKEVLKSNNPLVMSDFTMATIKNPSYLAAIAAGILAIVGLQRLHWREAQARTAFTLLALGLLVPVVMFVVGRYQFYYSWMAIIPASLGAVMLVEHPSVPRFARITGVSLLLAATLLGLPRRCIRIMAAWEQDQPGAVSRFALKNASPSDVVFLDASMEAFAVYYPLRATVQTGYWGELPVNKADLPKISVVFLPKTGGEAHLHEILGGNWRQVDSQEFGAQKLGFFLGSRFLLTAYRRF